MKEQYFKISPHFTLTYLNMYKFHLVHVGSGGGFNKNADTCAFFLSIIETSKFNNGLYITLAPFLRRTRRKCPPGTCSGNASHVNFRNVPCLIDDGLAAVAVEQSTCQLSVNA